ncbi:MAG TPA: VWA domain-containing protein [Jiangellaceae bacterium]
MIVDPVAPWWLLVAVFVPLLVIAVRMVARAEGPRRVAWARRTAMVVMLAAVAVAPGLDGGSAEARASSVDVVFVVDVTTSMGAEDYPGGIRLDGARADVAELAEHLAGARFSLVTFARDAVVELPFTTDSTALSTAMSVVEPESYLYATGSSVDRPLETLKALLDRAEESDPDRARVVFYLGDGEQTADSEASSFAEIGEIVAGGAVLGYGTADGGRMLQYDGFSAREDLTYVSDGNGGDAVSILDEEALGEVADQLGVTYLHRTGAGGPGADGLGDVVDLRAIAEISDDRDGATSSTLRLYWIPAVALGGLALWELTVIVLLLGETRRRR